MESCAYRSHRVRAGAYRAWPDPPRDHPRRDAGPRWENRMIELNLARGTSTESRFASDITSLIGKVVFQNLRWLLQLFVSTVADRNLEPSSEPDEETTPNSLLRRGGSATRKSPVLATASHNNEPRLVGPCPLLISMQWLAHIERKNEAVAQTELRTMCFVPSRRG